MLIFVLNGLENAWIYLASIPLLVVFSRMIRKPDWFGFFKLISRLFLVVPRTLLEAFHILFVPLSGTFDVVDIDEGEEAEKVLATTLTPSSVVFMTDGDRLHIHKVGRRKG